MSKSNTWFQADSHLHCAQCSVDGIVHEAISSVMTGAEFAREGVLAKVIRDRVTTSTDMLQRYAGSEMEGRSYSQLLVAKMEAE